MKLRFKKAVSIALAAMLAVPSTLLTSRLNVVAEGDDASMVEEWVMDDAYIVGEGAHIEMASGYLHVQSSAFNGNNPADKPAMFVNENQFDFTKDGHFDFTFKTTDGETSRFGIYLGYNDAGNGLFIGFDREGWFYQKYMAGDGEWFDGERHVVPTANVDTFVQISWTKDGVATLKVDGETCFDVDFNDMKDKLTHNIAIKCGSAVNEYTEASLKDFDMTVMDGEVASVKVVGGNGPLAGRKVLVDEDVRYTNNDGVVTFTTDKDEVKVVVSVKGYEPFEETVAVNGEAVLTKIPSIDAEIVDGSTLRDAIVETWVEEKENKVNEEANVSVEEEYLHVTSALGNGNNPGTKPAIFVLDHDFDFKKPGYVSFDLKAKEPSKARFGIYLGYNTDMNGMFVGFDLAGWFYQKYQEGAGDWYSGERYPIPADDTDTHVEIMWSSDMKMTLKVDGNVVFDHEEFDGIKDALGNKIAIRCGAYKSDLTDVKLKNIHYIDQEVKSNDELFVTGKVVDKSGKALSDVEVSVAGSVVTTNAEGVYTTTVKEGVVEVSAALNGYYINSFKNYVLASCELPTLCLEELVAGETTVIASDVMEVEVGSSFPYVKQYKLGDKLFFGRESAMNEIVINDEAIAVEDVDATFSEDIANYAMHVVNADGSIDCNIDVTMKVVENELDFNITKIASNNDTVIQTVRFDDHSLISVNSKSKHANLKGATMSTDTTKSGDEYYTVDANMKKLANEDFMYAFVSNDILSAGMWSNSEHTGRAAYSGVAGGSRNTRIFATTKSTVGKKENVTRLGLASADWYYNRIVEDSKGNSYTCDVTEMPAMKVIITDDMNGDGEVTWQDGAIAFRKIMNNPYKCEEVPELVAWRIAMNFGSQAQNPFLTTLDNVKKVALHTDGLGQSVLLKGYGNEGHDSGHPDYGDVGKRIGGAEDMNFMMDKGNAYGARFGVHVNASEMYPEAKAFNEDTVRRANGALTYGWNWIDQGIGLDGVYDVASGARKDRFNDLKALVGNRMDFIYVDVWGNRVSGPKEDAWETRKMSKTINDLGWRLGTEWGATNEYDSTFQHWATDLTYGGSKWKGENSEVMRFLRNHQKDAWVGDYPSYAGEANCPLLGGYNMKDFEGWQGRNDYDAYIENLYTHDLSTKFMQHYQVVKWVDAVGDHDDYKWNPAKEITLKEDPFNNESDTVVVTRKSVDETSEDYRHRTMTLNGVVVLDGKVASGDGMIEGDESYLLPWVWDRVTGEKVNDAKMYHFNTVGGKTTWTLTDAFSGANTLYMYELTPNGKVNETVVEVVDGTVTLDAKAKTPYVLTVEPSESIEVTWSEGMHIVDASFNDVEENLEVNWKKEGSGSATISKSQFSNPMLTLDGEVSLTQTLTDLEPNMPYVVLVGVDNRSDSKAAISLRVDGKLVDERYTMKSVAKNFVKAYTHSNMSATVDGTSYFQNMYAYFTAPKNCEVTLTLSKSAGEGKAYFDDIRIVQSDMKVLKKDNRGVVVGLKQDFEKSVQGLYPFVVGPIEGVEDNRIHLSERHDPYTQADWDVKKMDDVLTKNDPHSMWSVKINGLVQANEIAYRTIPQNFRFLPGHTYKVKFDYQAGSNDTYGVVVGNGEITGKEEVTPLPMAMGSKKDATYEFEVVGAKNGETWIGIKSTEVEPDLQGTSGAEANFGGYQELVLDNLEITEIDTTLRRNGLNVFQWIGLVGIAFGLVGQYIFKVKKQSELAMMAVEEEEEEGI